jgi:hypothetical protein
MSWRIPVLLVAMMLLPSTARAGDGDGVVVKAPLPGTPEHLIQKVFIAAQFDDYRGFYGDLCHRNTCKLTDVAMKSFRDKQWEKFKAEFRNCLIDKDSLSFRYEHTSPKKITGRTSKVTFYFQGGSMILKKDAEGSWKIYRLCE